MGAARLNEVQRAAIVSAYMSGEPLRSIAARFGVDHSYPVKLVERLGLDKKKRRHGARHLGFKVPDEHLWWAGPDVPGRIGGLQVSEMTRDQLLLVAKWAMTQKRPDLYGGAVAPLKDLVTLVKQLSMEALAEEVAE